MKRISLWLALHWEFPFLQIQHDLGSRESDHHDGNGWTSAGRATGRPITRSPCVSATLRCRHPRNAAARQRQIAVCPGSKQDSSIDLHSQLRVPVAGKKRIGFQAQVWAIGMSANDFESIDVVSVKDKTKDCTYPDYKRIKECVPTRTENNTVVISVKELDQLVKAMKKAKVECLELRVDGQGNPILFTDGQIKALII